MGAIERIFRGRRGGKDRPLAAQVASLFANGEQGLWYDATDVSSLYQDAGGTTPAYRPGLGQVDPPVGLVLDKRFGLVRGSERFVETSVIFSGESYRISPGVYRCYSSAGAYNLVNFGGSIVPGNWYELQFTIDSIAVVGTGLVLEGATTQSSTAGFITVGKKSIIVNAAGTYLGLKRSSSSCDYQISGVSIRELKGNHAYQTTTASRTTLSGRYNLFTATEDLMATGTLGGGAVRTATTLTVNSTSDYYYRSTGFSAPVGALITVSAEMSGTGSISIGALNGSGSDIGVTPIALTATPTRYTVTVANTSAGGVSIVFRGTGVATVANVSKLDIRVNEPFSLPPYQKVIDANTYDTAGFPIYLSSDGVDDGMVTGSIDFTATDKVFLGAALRKASASAVGMFIESSGGVTAGVNNGAFHMAAPNPAASNLSFKLVGTTSPVDAVMTANGFSSPTTLIASCLYDIGGAAITDEIKPRVNGAIPSLTPSGGPAGGGTFGNYPLYFFRRAGTSLPFKGRFYGSIIRAGSITDAQIAKVERYLNNKARAY